VISGRSIFLFYCILAVQMLCAFPFLYDLWGEVLGLRTTAIPWYLQEVIQMMASAGMFVGVIGAGIYMLYLHHSQKRIARLGEQMDVVSGNFQDHIQQHFDSWNLSRSEAEIAVYAMKGFSNAEIAELRGTTTATVKSQMNAIYRKCNFSNRQQLISFLVEELLQGVEMKRAA
jgi:DNA-binding NarL/FixJ family response regulator